MDLTQYQTLAAQTAVYPEDWKIFYPALKLGAEAGECQGKVGRLIRDTNLVITDEARAAIVDEIGDVLWYAAILALDLGVDFSEVAERNLEKLSDRQRRDVLHGSGDTR